MNEHHRSPSAERIQTLRGPELELRVGRRAAVCTPPTDGESAALGHNDDELAGQLLEKLLAVVRELG